MKESKEIKPPTPLHSEASEQALAAFLRGDPLPLPSEGEFKCVSSGAFNVSPDNQTLSLETFCTVAGAFEPFRVEDVKTQRLPNKHIFRIPFEAAVVSVQELGDNERRVSLHYQDAEREFHHIDLESRPSEKFEYSFVELCAQDKIRRVVEIRTGGEKKTEDSKPESRVTELCTLTGRFMADVDTVALQVICRRSISVPDQPALYHFWYETQPILAQHGRHALPFPDSYLVRQGKSFSLHTKLAGAAFTRVLQPNNEGFYTFEDVIDRLQEN